MMNDMQRKAREKSLQDLTGAMDDDEMKPLLTIKIEAAGGHGEPDGDELPENQPGDELPEQPAGDEAMMPGDEEENPFMQMVKKKMMEKMGR